MSVGVAGWIRAATVSLAFHFLFSVLCIFRHVHWTVLFSSTLFIKPIICKPSIIWLPTSTSLTFLTPVCGISYVLVVEFITQVN